MRKTSACLVLLLFGLTSVATAQDGLTPTAVGTEFQVNTYTTSYQVYASVASAANGDFVVVWIGGYQDGSYSGMFGQRFSASGAPQGAEFQVNTYTAGYQSSYTRSVAMDDSGNFVVVWDSDSQDGSSDGVFGQRFSSDGSPMGTEFQVNTYTTGDQYYGVVAADSDGDFIVAWASYGQISSYGDVIGQRFDSGGTPQGTEFQVNTTTGGYYPVPAVAANSNGDFVVVWEDYLSGYLYSQIFSNDGSPVGSEFQVNTSTGYHDDPSVSMDEQGNFIVVWRWYGEVRGRRFASDGTPQGNDFQVSNYPYDSRRRPSVAMDPDGDFVVVWQNYVQDGSDYGIFGQWFHSSGTAVGAEFQVNTYTSGDQSRPSVASNDDGDFVVTWDSFGQDGSVHGVFAQRFVVPSPVIVTGLGSTQGAGWTELIGPKSPFPNNLWLRVSWPAYNSAVGETRPVFCNLDSDIKEELVLGLGSYPGASTGGYVEIKDDADTGYSHLAWLRVGFTTYNNNNGETFPACGDLDGDGRDEIAVGLGNGGGGWVQAFDDASGMFAPLTGTPYAGGWIRVGWSTYNSNRGEVHPAIGNMDADASEELILGLGQTSAGWVQVLDDSAASFAPLAGTPTAGGWLQLTYGAYNMANGETWPAVGDLNGDGQAELILGVGQGGKGWVQVRGNSGTTFAPVAGTPTANGFLQVVWNAYNSAVGTVYPAAGDLDLDGRDELVLGLGTYPANGGWMDIREDLAVDNGSGLAHISWGRVHWSVYNSANGLTRPVIRR